MMQEKKQQQIDYDTEEKHIDSWGEGGWGEFS